MVQPRFFLYRTRHKGPTFKQIHIVHYRNTIRSCEENLVVYDLELQKEVRRIQ